jgi:hypothetical protein
MDSGYGGSSMGCRSSDPASCPHEGRRSQVAEHRRLPLFAPLDRAARANHAGLQYRRYQRIYRQAWGGDGNDSGQVAQALAGIGAGVPA